MTIRVRVTEDFQISVPDEARERLKIEEGDTLLVEVRDDAMIVTPEAGDATLRLRGLHREVWDGVDPDEYVRQEREAWGS